MSDVDKKKTDIVEVKNKNPHPTPAPGLQEWIEATNWTPSNGDKKW